MNAKHEHHCSGKTVNYTSIYLISFFDLVFQQVSFWPEDEENGGSELTMSSQLRKTRSMDSSCLELRPGPPSGNVPSATYQGPTSHLSSALSRARSEANLHASTLSLDPGKFFPLLHFYQNLGKNNVRRIFETTKLKGYSPNVEYPNMGGECKSERIEILIRSCIYTRIGCAVNGECENATPHGPFYFNEYQWSATYRVGLNT